MPSPDFLRAKVDLISQSQFVVGACGTAAVEAMMFDKFMVVPYKASLLSYIVLRS